MKQYVNCSQCNRAVHIGHSYTVRGVVACFSMYACMHVHVCHDGRESEDNYEMHYIILLNALFVSSYLPTLQALSPRSRPGSQIPLPARVCAHA